MIKPYQICTRCVMDTSVQDITFNELGVCNYCTDFLEQSKHLLDIKPAQRKLNLDKFIDDVKLAGKGKRYDCIIGVSGGVDSSWALVQAVTLGLRPLAVHMDNGWNSELAQNNIANLVRELGVDLYTHVIEWNEYRNLMQAFFDADVIDVELLYDNAMFTVNYRQAAKYGIKYILSGMNQASEGMRMPIQWNWHKFDKKNITEIGKKFGNIRIRTFPAMGTLNYIYFKFVKRIQWIAFLDFLDYNKIEAMQILQKNYRYKPYPYKHYESVFTRFYQGFILPHKFKVDKRRVHLGTLVAVGQLPRQEAMKDLAEIPYPSENALAEDKQYFLKKMGWELEQLHEYISRPEKAHMTYPSEKPFWNFIFISQDGRYFYNNIKIIFKVLRSIIRKTR